MPLTPTSTMSRCVLVILLIATATPVHAQKLRDQLADLFRVGPWTVPLQLGTSGDPSQPGAAVTADNGFLASSVAANASILGFLTRWVGAYPGHVPVSAGSGGVTFDFVGGLPVSEAVSPGPIAGERARTLGKGRAAVGVSYSNLQFNTLRGLPLDDVRLLFTHENITSATCDAQQGRSCAALGTPLEENDLLEMFLSLDMSIDVTSFFVTYGVLDFADIGVVMPVLHTKLDGTTRARVVPFVQTGEPPSHFIAGTANQPVLESQQSIRGSATGVGDLSARVKLRAVESERTALAFLGDVRFPTGDEADLLGAGHTSVRAIGVVSGHFGGFSPHVNLGYLWRSGTDITDAVLATAGFDQVIAPWATVGASLISELQVGTSLMVLPDPVTFTDPTPRTVLPLDAPDTRDNPVTAALGFKFSTASNITASLNTLIPVNRTGPRPDFAWSLGLQYDF